MTSSRARWLLLVLGFTVGTAWFGWFLGQRSVSPQEAAAQAEPPVASLITAPVELKELVSTLVLRGRTEASGRSNVVLEPSSRTVPIVTSIAVDAGSSVTVGQVMLEVAERPVFAFDGELPAFRTLELGSRGDDVLQLEQSLLDAGYVISGGADEVLRSSTVTAIRRLYDDAGFPRPSSAEGVLPLSEFVFVHTLPRRVESVLVERGDRVDGPVLSLASEEVEVSGLLLGPDRSLVEVGMAAEIHLDDLGVVLVAEVSELSDAPIDSSAGQYQVVVRPVGLSSGELPRDAVARVIIPLASSGGEVLVVPVAALSSGPDGAPRVEIAQSDGTTLNVPVRTGLTAGGEVAVVPVEYGALMKGDRVVVGA